MRAEATGDPGPWRQQAILGRGRWDADALRDIVCVRVLETFTDEDAVPVNNETGFLKQARRLARLHASIRVRLACARSRLAARISRVMRRKTPDLG